MERRVLLLGDERLYKPSEEVAEGELPQLTDVIEDLGDTLLAQRVRTGRGRAISAPQIGVHKRIIYVHEGVMAEKPVVLINPVLTFQEPKMMTLDDDCLSFPGLYVKVRRYRRCVLRYTDTSWRQNGAALEGGLAELIQHEYDHLDGILATMRAIDNRSFSMRL